jgi:hypothetical protein
LLALILLILFFIAYSTPNFEIKLRVGNKQFVFSIGNVSDSSESRDPTEEIVINSSKLSGAFDFDIGGKLNNNV